MQCPLRCCVHAYERAMKPTCMRASRPANDPHPPIPPINLSVLPPSRPFRSIRLAFLRPRELRAPSLPSALPCLACIPLGCDGRALRNARAATAAAPAATATPVANGTLLPTPHFLTLSRNGPGRKGWQRGLRLATCFRRRACVRRGLYYYWPERR